MWRKTQISAKSTEKLEFEKEQDTRLTLMGKLNLTREDFDDSPKYRDYEELVADILSCFNKKKNIDWATGQLETHRKTYSNIVARNVTRHIENNRRLTEEIKDNDLQTIKALKIIENKAEQDLFLKKLDKEEENLVKLGELRETTFTKKKREDVTNKRKDQMKAYEGKLKNAIQLQHGSLFWKQAKSLQPQPKSKSSSQDHQNTSQRKDEMLGASGYSSRLVNIRSQLLLSNFNILN